MKPEKRPRGKPLDPMKPVTVRTVILSQAMELRDDAVLLRMRIDELIKLLMNNP